jgi:2-polyprenyl-3-methyl-5-hydroxy-6-metoxy-1,4-benzoquinol methylase
MSNQNITTKDYLVSDEEFQLLYDQELDMLKTYPIPENIAKYYESKNYISHADKSKSLADYLYNVVKSFTLKSKVYLINQYVKENKTLLDIGAGTGDFLLKAKKSNWLVEGVEPNEKARNSAYKKGVDVKESLGQIHQRFNVISLWHVLEHLPNLENSIIEIKSKLEDEGILIIAVPNFKSYDAKHYKEFWAAYDTPRHLWHFSKTSIEKIFGKHSMAIIETRPMYFDSFYVSLLSQKHKTQKNNYLKAFITGLISNIKAIRTKEYSSMIYILKSV